MKTGKAYVGASGWSYKHWKGTFYPAELPVKDQFAFYLDRFETVEINNSFYRLPPISTFTNWRKSVPTGFTFAVKANRFITHNKKLNAGKGSFAKFFTHITRLRQTLGPVLFQLPPKWNLNAERLQDFLGQLPAGIRYSFEFRNQTWYDPSVYKALRAHNAAFCIYELEHHVSPMEVTADFVYLRLHGPGNKYQGSYADADLRKWAKQCKTWMKEGKDVYVYFDNDQEGYAAFNALTLQKLLKK